MIRLTTLSKRKRKLLKIQGIPIPSIPPLKDVNKLLNDTIVESLQHDPLLNPKEYDEEAAKIMNDGKLYIGMTLN